MKLAFRVPTQRCLLSRSVARVTAASPTAMASHRAHEYPLSHRRATGVRLLHVLLPLLILLSQPMPSCAVINTVVGILYTLLSDLGPNPVESPEQLRIIGAGLPRTGTSSLNAALRVLGYNSYHQLEIMKDKGIHASRWADVGAGRALPEDMFQFLSHYGYNATLDYPVAEYYDVALALYPEAKVIMTVRDDPKRWGKSWNTLMSSTALVWELSPTLTYPNPIRLLVPQKWRQMRELRCSYGVRSFGLQPCEMLNAYRSKPDGWLEGIYEKHVASVRGKVPPERLLEFNVKDGWEPLCEFLGLPVPDIPFPNINDSSLFIQFRRAWLLIVYAWIPLSVIMCWIVWRLLQRIMKILFPGSMKKQAKINDKVKSS